MDAREARDWLKQAERAHQIQKYQHLTDDQLREDIARLRRDIKRAKKSSEKRSCEAQIDDIWWELGRRLREKGDSE